MGSTLRHFGIVLMAALTAVAATFALNALLALFPPDIFKQRAAQAIADRTLIQRTALPFADDSGPFRYDFNDCLILAMLAARRPSDIISPRQPIVDTPTDWYPRSFYDDRSEASSLSEARGTIRHEFCHQLTKAASADVNARPYHRYVHLYVPLTGLGLATVGFGNYTLLLHALALLVPVILIGLAFRKRDRRAIAYVGLSLAYLAFSGFWRFSWNAALGPGEILLSSFILANFVVKKPGALFFAAAGALAGALDFLTGLIPSLLVLTLGIAAIEKRSVKDAVKQTAIVGTAAITTLVIKAIVVILLYGSSTLSDSASVLASHTSPIGIETYEGLNAVLTQFGINRDWLDHRLGFAAIAFAKFAYFGDLVGWGSRGLGALIILGGPVVLGLLGLGLIKRADPAGWIALLAIAGVVAWVIMLPEHSVAHALWMQRLPAWLSIILVGLICRLAVDRTADPADRKSWS